MTHLRKGFPCLVWLLIVSLLSTARGQQQVERLPLPKLQPPAKPIPFSLRRVIQVKLDTSEATPKLICMVDRFREEEREGNFVRFREEQRTRKITVNIDGEAKQVEQTYTVRVPFTQSGIQRVLVPAGRKPVSLPWDQAKLFRLDGSAVTLEDAEKQLNKLQAVFLIDNLRSEIEPTEDLLQQVLRPDILILATDQLRRTPGCAPTPYGACGLGSRTPDSLRIRHPSYVRMLPLLLPA